MRRIDFDRNASTPIDPAVAAACGRCWKIIPTILRARLGRTWAPGAIRFSLGRDTSREEIDAAADLLADILPSAA